MNTWQKLKEAHKKIDLTKKYPGYFYKPLMWLGMAGIFGFVVLLMVSFGHNTTWVYIECTSPLGCQNPFIECEVTEEGFFYIPPPECKFYIENECIGRNCENPTIEYKDYIGEKPPSIVRNGHILIFAWLSLIAVANHTRYELRKWK